MSLRSEDWSVLDPASPPRKPSLPGYQFSLWNSQSTEFSPSPWAQAPLQPSTNIWGPQVKTASRPVIGTSGYSTPTSFGSSLSLGSLSGVCNRNPNSSTTTSLVSSCSSSSLMFDDPYLSSPPPSPPTTAAHTPKPLSPSQSNATFDNGTIISSTCGPLYLVRFKGNRINVFTAPGTAVYKTGDTVMVDADRGRDLGTIVAANISRHEAAALKQRHHSDRHQALRASSPGATPPLNAAAGPIVYTPKQILAPATPGEISDMEAKLADEAAAVSLCTKKAMERNLDMSIVDAEYQWDRRKLTFFYVANSRVDFRELVRELFRVYKTRIWMCATSARS
ncbi:hypothetical protein DASB73_013810 [Starmerella bacillaris]|uniref:PSP1 C-terminal domain-containing protein n=1 Tax=Starmerella bacillaris TaxID=1247836 RepID=A0AAV5RH13_STABA|nr:hypothetical protein DASB73_013810 [Starmerella bacillaris]